MRPDGALVAGALGILLASCGAREPQLTVEARLSVPEVSAVSVSRIAFGSCNDIHREQPLWAPIRASKPDLFIWTGDIVYADRIQLVSYGRAQLYVPLPQLHDPSALERAYSAQRRHPGYAKLLDSVPVIGSYDDHDFGKNNGGGEYPHKAATARLLLDFLNVPEDSPRRTRQGVYGSYAFGPPGSRVRVILLDGRYHRGRPGPAADVLGPQQEAWLRATLTGSDADAHIIVSGVQVLALDHPYETWARFPRARDRLFRIVEETRPRGLVFLSGDRHHAEYSELRRGPLVLRDLTSSGLTHVYDQRGPEPNRHRRGPLIRKLNFGLLEYDWQRRTVRAQIRGEGGVVLLAQTWGF